MVAASRKFGGATAVGKLLRCCKEIRWVRAVLLLGSETQRASTSQSERATSSRATGHTS
jgi:hypothetical protein